MNETEILKLAEAYWEADKKLDYQSFGAIYLAAFRRGFRVGEQAEAKRIYADTLEMAKEEVSGVPV